MKLTRFQTANDFYAHAERFLCEHEAEHNLLRGITANLIRFTDLSNPTSNHIYPAIGYRPVCDADEYKFES